MKPEPTNEVLIELSLKAKFTRSMLHLTIHTREINELYGKGDTMQATRYYHSAAYMMYNHNRIDVM